MAKEPECRDDFKTLFEKSEDLNQRVAVTENNVHHIQNSAKSIESNVSKFMETINGIPIQNQKAIEELKQDVKSNTITIIKWGAVIGTLMTLLSFAISILF